MKENKAPKISVEEIMQTINQELSLRKDISKSSHKENQNFSINKTKQNSPIYQFAKKIGKYLHRKGLYRLVAFFQNNLNLHQSNYIYTLDDFIKFYDEEFIDNAYELILNRPPDHEGKNRFLSLLRSGDVTKTDIVISLHFSKEGRKQNVIVLGAKKRYFITQMYKVPFLGYITRLFITLIGLPRLLKRINQFENNTAVELRKHDNNHATLQKLIDIKIDELQENLNTKAKSLQDAINTKTNKKEFEAYLQTVKYAKEQMKITQQNMLHLIDEAKQRLPKKLLNQEQLLTIVQEEKHRFDTLYVEFEDKFRGSREDIKTRVEVYLLYLKDLAFEKEQIEVLDVGCGRAEWLELLYENGYKAKGIDLNQIMVSLSCELGFDVNKADVIEYLKSLEDESLAVITGFHIIEHLPFEILMTLLEESFRVLKKGGMIIFETPNPENILVGSHYFYTDPTHINPLVPATVEFLTQYVGFEQVQIKRLHKYTQHNQIDLESSFIQNNFSNEMDYSVIGYKT